MALNQLYLTKSGSNGWVEDSSAIISIESSDIAIGNRNLRVTGTASLEHNSQAILNIKAPSPQIQLDDNTNRLFAVYKDGVGQGALHLQNAGASKVKFSANSSSDSYINAGSFGIGTATPSANGKLTVEGRGIFTEGIAVGTANPTHYVHITGDTFIGGNLTVTGTTTTINSETITVDDKNIELGSVDTPNDTTANGGGITLLGTTNKSIIWSSSTADWASSEHFSVADGKYLKADKLRARDGDGLYLVDDGDNGIFIKDGGNVGIFHDTPRHALDVSGFICTNSPNPGIRFMENDTTDENWDIHISAGNLLFGTISDAFGSAAEKMRLTPDGNVGIGATNPISQLTVSGQQEIFSLHYGDEKKLRTYCMADGMVWAIGDNTEGGDEDIRFDTRAGYPSYIKMGGGKFGIGTPSPDYQLTSSGDVHFGLNQHAHLYATQASSSFGDTFNTDVALNFGTNSALHIGGAPPPTNNPVVGMTISGANDKYLFGLGTTLPQSKLHLYDTQSTILKVESTSNDAVLRLDNSASQWDIDNDGNGSDTVPAGDLHIRKDNGSTKVMTFSNALGFVGVGQHRPTSCLEVKNTHASMLGLWRAMDIRNSANGSPARIEGGALNDTTQETGAAIALGLFDTSSDGSATRGYISFETKGAGGLEERMRIDADGNVGIGTSDPSSDCDLTIQGTDSSDGGEAKLCLMSEDGTQNGAFAHVDEAGAERISVRVGGHSKTVEKLTIFNNSTVGIGLGAGTVPDAYLHVSGASSTKYAAIFDNRAGNDGVRIFAGNNGFGSEKILDVRKGNVAGDVMGSLLVVQGDGNVGIGTETPDENLEITGRFHIGQAAAPSTTTDKLYNVGGTLYWDGTNVLTDTNTTYSVMSSANSYAAGLVAAGSATHNDNFLRKDGTWQTVSASTSNYSNGYTLNQDCETSDDVQFQSLGINVAPSGTAGSIIATNDIIAYASSDERLKDNITTLSSPIEKVCQIKGIEFDWNEESYMHLNGHDIGVLAQDVEKVLPEVVATRDDGYKAVRYEKMVPLLIEAIKDQQEQIKDLKARLDEAGL